MRIITVQELTRHIKSLIEKEHLLANIWVKGEISNFKAHSSGHLYFTLKDDYSSVKVVMFRSRSRLLPFQPQNGSAVIVRGYVSVFERDGAYQLYAEEITPDGTGALYLAFEQLKARLAGEGLFDERYKKKTPLLPDRIGIVTSPTGAAIRDMLHIIERRWPGREILLVPVQVQGDAAPQSIAGGIRLLNQFGGVELIITGRGGGSLEDLWAFNTEVVARSIFDSQVPVISAVGHETDFTIADFVADVRAATPSAAAELAVPDRQEMVRYIQNLKTRLVRAVSEKLLTSRRRLEAISTRRVFERPVDIICGVQQQALDQLALRLQQVMKDLLEEKEQSFTLLVSRLNTLSPLATLARGYSICTTPDREQVISDAATVQPGDRLSVLLFRGRLDVVVARQESG
ncbi:MAG: exodeoxyribonuclease VII large subunit [Peptococcaceae bacterium]|jgi:exodeoxyribonuclease VII large subunit|nr:exodeoxyribonuclease VII large subunit [Peptococcaceae bacterium]